MYGVMQTFHVRCTITSPDGKPFSHTFCEAVDCDPDTIYTPLEAIENAVMTFRSRADFSGAGDVLALPRHPCSPSRMVESATGERLMHCLRQKGIRTAEDADAFKSANPAYAPDVVVLCGRCGFFHCSNPDWLVARQWEEPVENGRLN